MSAAAESTSVAVQTTTGCAWTATSNVSWLTIGGTSAGIGNGAVTVTASANTGASRTGTATIAGQTFTVTQAGACVSTIDPTSQAAPAAGGTAAPVAVTSPAGCDWSATTATSWLTITNGASGTGNGTVEFQVAENIGPARTGTLSIAGRTHTVNQASGCAVSIDSSSASFSSLGGAGTPIAVSAASGCAWTATTAANWITVTSGASGSGNGAVTYVVGLNLGGAREATIVIGGKTFTVSQAALLNLPLGQSAQ